MYVIGEPSDHCHVERYWQQSTTASGLRPSVRKQTELSASSSKQWYFLAWTTVGWACDNPIQCDHGLKNRKYWNYKVWPCWLTSRKNDWMMTILRTFFACWCRWNPVPVDSWCWSDQRRSSDMLIWRHPRFCYNWEIDIHCRQMESSLQHESVKSVTFMCLPCSWEIQIREIQALIQYRLTCVDMAIFTHAVTSLASAWRRSQTMCGCHCAYLLYLCLKGDLNVVMQLLLLFSTLQLLKQLNL